MSSIFGNSGGGGSGTFVTLDTDQEITGSKRMRNIDNELTCAELSCNTSALFTGEVEFADEFTAPHCAIYPVNANDLCNKAYVDSVGLIPANKKNLFLNYSQAGPVSGKRLSETQVIANQSITTSIPPNSVSTTVEIFSRTFAALGVSRIIPAGIWSLTLYANITNAADLGHVAFSFTLAAQDTNGGAGILTIATSAYTEFVNTISPAVGTFTTTIVLPETDCTVYEDLLLRVDAINTRTGNAASIVNKYQFSSTYSYVVTSYTESDNINLLSANNLWTGTNTFNQTIVGNISGNAATVAASTTVDAGVYRIPFIDNESTFATSSLKISTGTGVNYLEYIPSLGELSANYFNGNTRETETVLVNPTSDITVQTNPVYPLMAVNDGGAQNVYIDEVGPNIFSYIPSTGILNLQGIEAPTTLSLLAAGFVALTLNNTTATFGMNEISGPITNTGSPFRISNSVNNSSNLIIQNNNIASDIVLRQLGSRNVIVQTSGSSTRATFSDTALTLAVDLTISEASPVISSSSGTNPLVIRSGLSQGINFQTNNNSTQNPLTISASGADVSATNFLGFEFRGPSAGSLGTVFVNTVNNSGGVKLNNENTASDITVNQLGARTILLQTASTTRLSISAGGISTPTFIYSTSGHLGADSGSAGALFGNTAANSGGVSIVNSHTASDIVVRNSGINRTITFQTNGTNNRFTIGDTESIFTTSVTGVTETAGNNTTRLATTAFVQTALAGASTSLTDINGLTNSWGQIFGNPVRYQTYDPNIAWAQNTTALTTSDMLLVSIYMRANVAVSRIAFFGNTGTVVPFKFALYSSNNLATPTYTKVNTDSVNASGLIALPYILNLGSSYTPSTDGIFYIGAVPSAGVSATQFLCTPASQHNYVNFTNATGTPASIQAAGPNIRSARLTVAANTLPATLTTQPAVLNAYIPYFALLT